MTTSADSGPGSLRDCILKANATGSGDTITFQQATVIYPLTPLPAVTTADTLNGDLNSDGNPDVLINGSKLSTYYGNGLEIGPAPSSAGATTAELLPLHLPPPIPTRTRIIGICIQDCPLCGIWIHGRGNNIVRSCYIGVTLFGGGAQPNGMAGILIQTSDNNTVGGTSAKHRNLFTCKASFAGYSYSGLVIDYSNNNRVVGNKFGTDWSGMYGIGEGDWHVQVSYGEGNRIGGTTAAERNLFAGKYSGVRIYGGTASQVQGNWFGLGSDGNKALPLKTHVLLIGGSRQNVIGGTTEGAGNVFGVLPDGTPVGVYCGVSIAKVRAYVTRNVFARNQTGVKTVSTGANARIFRNVFRACKKGVWVRSGFAMLGNLGNSATDDDGGNQFKMTNTWHIHNSTESGIRAEGNDFGTTVKKAIDAKIRDELDDPNTGRMDFVPLAGGVMPTGETRAAGAVLSGVAAVPTRDGAEVAFTLTAPADVTVTVLNLAGRPVAMVQQDCAMEPGLQRVVWVGQTLNGTHAPNGQYLVRVSARSEGGRQSSALASVSLQ